LRLWVTGMAHNRPGEDSGTRCLTRTRGSREKVVLLPRGIGSESFLKGFDSGGLAYEMSEALGPILGIPHGGILPGCDQLL